MKIVMKSNDYDIFVGDDEDYRGIALNCEVNDFDPYIKYGRDNQLFVKRPILNKLVETTRYSEPEIINLMTMYKAFAMPGKGLIMKQFDKFWAQITNVEHHPFIIDIFIFFDRETQDQTIDFFEFVKSMDIVERGTFDEKCQYCFAMYDVIEQGFLDIYSLR